MTYSNDEPKTINKNTGIQNFNSAYAECNYEIYFEQ